MVGKNYLQIIISLVILSGLSGCGTINSNICTTDNNLILYRDDTKTTDCNRLNTVDNKIRDVYTNSKEITDTRFKSYKQVSGYLLIIHNSRYWVDEYGREVSGLTWCNTRTIEIGNQELGDGALAHEIAHVIQGCDDPNHSMWESNGINNEIERIKSELREH